MKKAVLVFLFLIFAVLMLPGILHPPTEATANSGSEVRQLALGLETALLDYHQAFGKFPEGGAGEILSALRGKNDLAKQFIVIDENKNVNEHGEMLDPWGTPFRIAFDPGAKVAKIHSAGPNLIFEDKPSKHGGDDFYSWHDPAFTPSPLPF